MAHMKNRRPEFLFTEDVKSAMAQFDKASKADWCDLYYDLYRQVFGEMASGEDIMADVSHRLEILKKYRAKKQVQ